MSDTTRTNRSDAPAVSPAETNLAEDVLGGENARGEVTGCPTGLSGLNTATPEAHAATEEFKPEVEELKGSRITGRAK